jgi:hypothetical protein
VRAKLKSYLAVTVTSLNTCLKVSRTTNHKHKRRYL